MSAALLLIIVGALAAGIAIAGGPMKQKLVFALYFGALAGCLAAFKFSELGGGLLALASMVILVKRHEDFEDKPSARRR